MGVSKQKKINHSLWWASDPREVPDPSTKNLFIYHCDTIRHGHPSEKMAGTPFLCPLLLSCVLFLCSGFFRKNYALGVWFFSPVFFHFGCENVSFLDGHGGKRGQKDRMRANRKVTKVPSDTQGEVRPSQDSSHTDILWYTEWNTRDEWIPVENRRVAQWNLHMQNSNLPPLIHYCFHSPDFSCDKLHHQMQGWNKGLFSLSTDLSATLWSCRLVV